MPQIMAGRSFEQADRSWKKLEISVEEIDLERLSREHKFDLATLTADQAFYLTEAVANIWELTVLTVRFPDRFATPTNVRQLAEFKELRDKIIAEVKAAEIE